LGNWENYVEFDSRYSRPTEVEHLVADASKAKKKLGWQAKTGFEDLIRIMLKYDFEAHGLKR
jgi:GDPmannose 4,6-dehydratase